MYIGQSLKMVPNELCLLVPNEFMPSPLPAFFDSHRWHVGILIPPLGIKPVPLQWKCHILLTGPPGKSLMPFYNPHSMYLGWYCITNKM